MLSLAVTSAAPGEPKEARPLVFYASQSGASTLDQDADGGNPFASALVALLARPSLTMAELKHLLVSLTKEKSKGYQVPDVAGSGVASVWKLKPIATLERRVALVFVYSNYTTPGLARLPGAQHDLERVSHALARAGFDVQTLVDPTGQSLRSTLDEFSKRSATAHAAFIYTTGHGFEHKGRVYLLPSDVPFRNAISRLPEFALDVQSLTGALNAGQANVLFYGGCRTPW